MDRYTNKLLQDEPYRMVLFGKDYREVEVLSCEFMTSNNRLFILVADTTQHLHILQYDPEDPSSLSGQRLVRKSEFFSGKEIGTMVLVPFSVKPGNEDELVPLCAGLDGSLSTVLPVNESEYRALYVMQQQISEKEEHPCGLNPRMHRSFDIENTTSGAGRVLLDYGLIKRFEGLSLSKMEGYGRRIGKNGVEEMWRGLKGLEDALDYL